VALLTHGTVAEVNVFVEVCYTVILGIFCIESAYFNGQIGISDGTFSGGGDSGSLIVTDNASNSPVGLLFAGSEARTIANPIGPVLDRFGVTIDPGTGGEAPPDLTDPIAAFLMSCSKNTCTFTDQSTDNVGVTAWSWSFGDGTAASVLRNPRHTFQTGTHDWLVTLTAFDAAGNDGMANRTVRCTIKGKNTTCR
jgi:PKD repeat protein